MAKPNDPSSYRTKDGGTGYCDPPVKHQFQPGQSGNPEGRPPKMSYSSNLEILTEILEQKIDVTVPGNKTKRVTVREAIVLRRVSDALKGNEKAIDWVEDRDLGQDPFDIEEFDVESFLAEVRKESKK